MSEYEVDPADAMEMHIVKQEKRIADLERQLAAVQVDADRYRWLRSNDLAPSITGIWYGDFTLDAEIDEARKPK